jgi:hypothetical protein
MWSEALLCAGEPAGHPETSILGRLFGGKSLPDHASFRLASNLGVNFALRPFVLNGPGGDRRIPIATMARSLASLALEDGRTIEWCLERLEIEMCEATIDGFESVVSRELDLLCVEWGLSLLAEEREQLIVALLAEGQAAAREEPSRTLTPEEFEEFVRQRAAEARRVVDQLLDPTTPSLLVKLSAAGFSDEEIEAAATTRFRFSRERRSAVGEQLRNMDRLTDEIAMACMQVHALRRTGTIPPGMPSFSAVAEKVEALHGSGPWGDLGIPLSLAWGALHDITDRCQNEYM